MNPRLVAIVAVGIGPWTVLVVNQHLEFVFLWGLATTDPVHAVSIVSYVGELTQGLPERLLAWPISTLLYSGGLVSAISGSRGGWEDRRFTAGLLVLAGASHLGFAFGIMTRNPSAIALPIGVVGVWVVVWWYEWPSRIGTPDSS